MELEELFAPYEIALFMKEFGYNDQCMAVHIPAYSDDYAFEVHGVEKCTEIDFFWQ